jgi:hypothetical protein
LALSSTAKGRAAKRLEPYLGLVWIEFIQPKLVMARLVRAIHFPEAENIPAPLLENGWPPQGRP